LAFQTLNPSFADLSIQARLENIDSFLKEIDSIIDFRKLKPVLNKNKIGTKNAAGEKAYDNVLMFKILLLQKFYDLSDKKAEEYLYSNLLFMKFVGLGLEDNVPDDTTICRFRNSLIEHKIYDKLFDSVNQQLEDKGLIAKTGKAILVDATLVKSQNDSIKDKDKEQISSSKTKVEELNEAIDLQIQEECKQKKPSVKKISKLVKQKIRNSKTFKNEELDTLQNIDTKDIKTSKDIIENEKDSYNHKEKIDTDVRVGYQAGKHEYASGYKGHIAVDEQSGAIVETVMTFANTHDIEALETIIDSVGDENINSLYADKAYDSAEIAKLLEDKKIENNVCKKEKKNMSDEEKKAHREEEKPKHKVRSKVEHTFARIKTQMKCHTTRYIGLVRNNLNFTIVCIASNLKLFAHKQIRAQKLRSI